jgi:Zn-finger nucleic acid-binding protein
VYRDEYERCPRCHVELIDTGTVRSCTACRGQWASQAALLEMAAEMTRPNPPQIRFLPHKRAEKLACPSCGNAMGTWRFHKTELDRCEKHGIWFDRDELEQVLYAVFVEEYRDD